MRNADGNPRERRGHFERCILVIFFVATLFHTL
jgi:hypothetical protein